MNTQLPRELKVVKSGSHVNDSKFALREAHSPRQQAQYGKGTSESCLGCFDPNCKAILLTAPVMTSAAAVEQAQKDLFQIPGMLGGLVTQAQVREEQQKCSTTSLRPAKHQKRASLQK
jgi:hypothetical protein